MFSKKIMFGLCLAFNVFSTAQAEEARISGIGGPIRVIKTPRDDIKNSHEGGFSFQECHVYPAVVVVAVDSGQKGSDAISVRSRASEKGVDKICSRKRWRGEIKLPVSDHYFLGMAGTYIFTKSADGFGESGGIWIYDALSGKLLDEVFYHINRDFHVVQDTKSKRVSVEYFELLKPVCSFAKQVEDCWVKTRVANHIPHTIKLTAPDCVAIYKSKEFLAHPQLMMSPSAIQVFTKVRIVDIRDAQRTYLESETLCNVSP